jgi:hypothetical protein
LLRRAGSHVGPSYAELKYGQTQPIFLSVPAPVPAAEIRSLGFLWPIKVSPEIPSPLGLLDARKDVVVGLTRRMERSRMTTVIRAKTTWDVFSA